MSPRPAMTCAISTPIRTSQSWLQCCNAVLDEARGADCDNLVRCRRSANQLRLKGVLYQSNRDFSIKRDVLSDAITGTVRLLPAPAIPAPATSRAASTGSATAMRDCLLAWRDHESVSIQRVDPDALPEFPAIHAARPADRQSRPPAAQVLSCYWRKY